MVLKKEEMDGGGCHPSTSMKKIASLRLACAALPTAMTHFYFFPTLDSFFLTALSLEYGQG